MKAEKNGKNELKDFRELSDELPRKMQILLKTPRWCQCDIENRVKITSQDELPRKVEFESNMTESASLEGKQDFSFYI